MADPGTLPGTYLSLGAQGRDELVVNKSRFIATAGPAGNPTEAVAMIEAVAAEFADATHNVYAYRVGLTTESQRFHDAGEPGGTAGLPLLEILKREELRNAVVVVSRYFGGHKLGARGLVRAYAAAGKAGITAAGIVCQVRHRLVAITYDYAHHGRLENFLKDQGLEVLDTTFGDQVILKTALPADAAAGLLAQLTNLASGRLTVEQGGNMYRPLNPVS